MSQKKTDAQIIDRLYSIGEVSKLCNVSKKTLRFYDKLMLFPLIISQRKITIVIIVRIRFYLCLLSSTTNKWASN